MKATCIKYLQEYVAAFQERRAKVTDAVVDEFMSPRPLEWKGNPKVPRADLVVPVTKPDGEASGDKPAEGDGAMTKNQLKKLQKQQQNAKKKEEKAAAKAKESEGA